MPSFEGKPDQDKRIVISGVAGLFPGSRNVKELSNILYNKEYPISSENCRWKYEHPEMVPFIGKVPDLELFDAQFFKVHYRLSQRMDPMSRKILEQAYQAIYDAGISPQQLDGMKTGVYLGCGFSETEKASFFDESSRNGFGLIGCNKSMFANRISYWLNAKGPSLCIDQACCSTFAALVSGYQAILRGECEAALVAASSICLHPQSIVHYNRAQLLSPDGKVRSFDAKANGCVKSEAVGVLFLQRAKDALRVYAEVVHVKSQFTSLSKGEKGPNYGFYRSPSDTINFLNNFYNEANVPPQAVKYVEAFGSGIPDADKAELEVLSEVFCKGRDDPLFVGCVTSNIGYSESASGISAITKVLLGYNNGKLASNLHCDTPRQDVDAVKEGRIQIVTEHHPMDPSYAAINSYSYNGVNAHVLLKGHNVQKDLNRYKTTIPYLVTISGRQESSVQVILKDLKTRPIDPEELALLHNIHEKRISAHIGRGFTILATNDNNETISLCEKKGYFDDATRPLWFVYSGMGSQWAGMGTELMRIPTFAAAIQRCHSVLEPKGVDIVKIITSPDPKTFDNILNSFVGNAAIQIGLTDILKKLEIFPDKVIGHSVGELGCAYADGCFTAEEMIMVAYSRGLVSIQTPFIVGSMAAVGKGHQEILKMLPPEIEVACHNSSTSCTISGPSDIMKTFISELTSKKIFAKEVACSNIAYHSRYIAEAGPGLLEHLNKVIKEPKLRSERWISTSVPQDQWNEPSAMYSSAEYHTNNLLRPVLFEEALKLIPPNAVLVEIAPHGLLQAILKRSLPVTCLNLSLTQRGNSENINYLLKAIGELYMVGFNPVIKTLYPKIDFPVSTGTPMLSHLVDWVHDENWKIPLYVAADKRVSASCNFVISVHDDEHSYLRGHVIREKNVYPFASALVAVWDTLVMSLGLQRKKISVQFKDVRFHSQPILSDERLIQLNVMLHRGSGKFEVMDGKTEVISGFIKEYNINQCQSKLNDNASTENEPSLNAEDIYNLLYIRDYNYFGDFRSIHCANASITKAKILWRDSWDTFIDGLLQLNFLRQSHNTTSQIKFIKNIEINVDGHISNNGAMESGSTLMTAHLDKLNNSTRCGGVFLQNVQLQNLPKTNGVTETMDTLKFIPHFSTTAIDEATLLDIYLQEAADNTNKDLINITKINNTYKEDVTSSRFSAVVRKFVEKKIKFRIVSRNKILSDTSLQNVDLVYVENLSIDNDLCRSLYSMLNMNTFIINKEDNANLHSIPRPSLLYRVVCAHSTGNNRLELVRWRPSTDAREISTISVNSQSDLPMLFSTITSVSDKQSLIVLSCYPPLPMLKNIVKDYRKTTNKNISVIMINKTSNQFETGRLCSPDLAFGIVVDDVMGGEYCLPIPQTSTVEGRMSLEYTSDVNSLKWVEVSEPTGSGIKVMVHYAGLSIVDAKKIAGIIKSTKHENQNVCGMEFSGIVERTGSRVMGLVENGAVSTKIQVHPNMMWPVPDYWNLEDAATVPLAYCLALYCLCIKSHLYSGMRILVHGGTGALGQAVISIALAHDCEVFTTVSSMSKKSFLRKLFPELKDDHIGNSRNDSFSDMVLNITKGKGCDIVISNVKGELRSTTLKCCGSSGITIDTTILQDQEDYNLGMAFMFFSRGFTTVDITSIFSSENIEILKRLQLLVSEGIARGYVRPLSRITYGAHDAPEALRLIAGNRHRGRVLLDLKQISPIVQTRLKCSSEFNHLVVSDDDIFGIHLIERLISRGAKKLFLQWKNPSNILEFKTRSWEKIGVNVNIYYEDVLNSDNARVLLDKISIFGPIEGVYLIAIDDNYAIKMENVLKQLTLMKQKFNPYLKYSTIIRVDSKNEEKRCNFEFQRHEIPTIINLPKLKGINDPLRTGHKGLISVQNAIDALEFTLTTPQISGVALKWSDIKISILERIFSISDLNNGKNINLSDINLSMTLKDLGIDVSSLDSIQACLCDYYNISRSRDNILNLTVRELIEIEKGVLSKTHYEETQGMWTFFSYVDKDELQATNKMIFMPSLTRNAAMNSQEFELSQTYLCVVPGIEGHYKRFQKICERLKLPVLLLQPGLEKSESICETAERLVEIMPKKAMELHKRFYLLGYEYGVFIALKMAAILEEKGWTGTVFCIGGSPNEICKTINNKLQEYDTDVALQVAVIKHIFILMTGADTKELDCVLSNSMTWQERVECCVQNLRGRVGYSNQFTRELIETTYSRVAQLRSSSAESRAIQSQLVSMRSKSPDDHETDSSLQCYSKNPVIEYDLNVPFSYLTKDPQCAAIINRHLDKDILKEFENTNLCETYLINEGYITNV
ncbi:fatty acid synthase-like [Nymphalis io]|uniref:fatty acid synthase-like n=1 Tax=Inachis io TaxID=171585 RepID=UPI0021698005|nr:fatty acid synthase-like [Nymphalis io]XP_050353037.1 fatty acid synthase-like [Nymphalis io]XP_050353038.1 fatty acid synthase-like [Nymphalis io]